MARLKDLFFKSWTKIHEVIFKVTKGRLLGKLRGMEVGLLATTGRKSGERRETMLTCPIVEDGRVVLVASYYGDTRNPAWYLNLRAQPEVEITMHGRTTPVVARVVEGDERAALWPRVVASYAPYARYQDKTDREIPLVMLDPR